MVEETTSCSSSASNTLHDITLKAKAWIGSMIERIFYLRNKRGLPIRLANGE